MESPAASGVPRVTVPAAALELDAPPLGWAGVASSSFNPRTEVVPPPFRLPVKVVDVRKRKSAVPAGTGRVAVVSSMTLKRRRVNGAPVLLVIFLRIEIVPRVEFASIGAGSRASAHADVSGPAPKHP